MFYYLNGVVAHIAFIDCGGVGYACRTTNNTLSHLQKGKPAKLYTHLNVREDAMELFGFSTENELNCFQLLTSVSGVGPKAALSILSAATPESLAMSIITGDEKALTVAQGIGKKIAQRIILELKDWIWIFPFSHFPHIFKIKIFIGKCVLQLAVWGNYGVCWRKWSRKNNDDWLHIKYNKKGQRKDKTVWTGNVRRRHRYA